MNPKNVIRRGLAVVVLTGFASCAKTYTYPGRDGDVYTFTEEENNSLKRGSRATSKKGECCFFLDEETGEVYTGACWLTTICCGFMGLTDDCWELSSLRRFRDKYLLSLPEGQQEVERYFSHAPMVGEYLKGNPKKVFTSYFGIVLPCALLASLRLNSACHSFYRKQILGLSIKAGSQLGPT